MPEPERFDRGAIARNHRRGHEVGKVHHEQFFGRVAHGFRIIDDERAGLDALEQMRRRDIGQIERRVLAQQHDIDLSQIDAPHFAKQGMLALDVLDL